MPWFDQRAVVISHAFTNWRFGSSSQTWRWALLPEVYAYWRKKVHRRRPRGYGDNKVLDDPRVQEWVQAAARSIVDRVSTMPPEHCCRRKMIDELIDKTTWPDALLAKEYERNEKLRPCLEAAVGLGLGVFDLVIMDEAHKGRAEDSGLNRLAKQVLLRSNAVRQLALTATPIELDSQQWVQMLDRIDASVPAETISEFAESVNCVRQCPSDADARSRFERAARVFERELRCFVLRRDKRQDPSVKKFAAQPGEDFHSYRREQEIVVEMANLTNPWKQAVCAAEALSFVMRLTSDSIAKRLRLTMGNGHGIAALLDHVHSDEVDDRKQNDDDDTKLEDAVEGPSAVPDKRFARAQWWQGLLLRPFQGGATALLDHPALLAAVDYIESVHARGEKVLVFGRFTRPLRVLVDLLNARELLRCLDTDQPWPKSKVYDGEWEAVCATRRQLGLVALDRDLLDKDLDRQYQRLESQRRSVRENLVTNIAQGFSQQPAGRRFETLFAAFKTASDSLDETTDQNTLAVVARAMQEYIGPNIASATPADYAGAFVELIMAVSDRDENEAADESEWEATEASERWLAVEERLREEYSRPEGGFARLMYGETKPPTRRLLQLAFNRGYCYPRVLVAQSVVGREGLNLHKACRTVLLLHAEWNPGVVEQQIGRVDRIASLWERKLAEALTSGSVGAELPRIEIRSVIFRGTYDEHNWQVLRERWDDLRAQLHGMVISPQIAAKYAGDPSIIQQLNAAAPNFSPPDQDIPDANIMIGGKSIIVPASADRNRA